MDSEIELSAHAAPVEFSTLQSSQYHDDEQENGSTGFSLPPTDRGKDAWLFLAAGFATEALVWGWMFSFGVFQEYYSHGPFSSDASNVAVIGSTATGIMYMSTIVLMPIYSFWPWIRRLSVFFGLPIMLVGIISASFANTVPQLILTQGICYAIGGSLLYCPSVLFIDEWFVRRKGLAFGIMWAGTGAAGMILPFIVTWCLQAFGFRTVLRMWAVAVTLIIGPLLYFVKPRLPVASTRQARPLDLNFLLSPVFWTIETSNILQSLGYFLPSIYLPTIAQSYGSSSASAALTLVFQNLASVFGALAVGALVDRFHVLSVMFIVATVSALAVFFLWGFSQSLPLLIIFSITYGLSAGGFSTCWAGVVKETQRHYAGADTGMIVGLLGAGRGIGAVMSGPLSTALIKSSALHDAAYAYGTDFGSLIIFTGATATAGGIGFFVRQLGLI